jgi:hypothetical protein
MFVSQYNATRKWYESMILRAALNGIRYEQNELKHEDVFNYLDSDHTVKAWPPTSDCSFITFKALMKQEWAEFTKKQNGQ